jgi:hypothetical protein
MNAFNTFWPRMVLVVICLSIFLQLLWPLFIRRQPSSEGQLVITGVATVLSAPILLLLCSVASFCVMLWNLTFGFSSLLVLAAALAVLELQAAYCWTSLKQDTRCAAL